MHNKPLHLLITRPEKQGRILADKLSELGFESSIQPLFDYLPLKSNFSDFVVAEQKQQLKPKRIFIFVSVAAVEYAQAEIDFSPLAANDVIAVGHATQKALLACGINAIVPSVQTSEGILALALFSTAIEQEVVIVRGNGGREYLAEQLQQRGAKVHYCQVYQRQWRQLSKQCIFDWQKNQINAIVVTSEAILEKLYCLTSVLSQQTEQWLQTCCWFVVSERILVKSKALGLTQVVNTQGASDQAIIDAIQTFQLNKSSLKTK